jgi:hypothetical protein
MIGTTPLRSTVALTPKDATGAAKPNGIPRSTFSEALSPERRSSAQALSASDDMGRFPVVAVA